MMYLRFDPVHSDPVHCIKDVFFLRFDLHTDLLLPELIQFILDLPKGLGNMGDVHHHHHVKISLDNRLGNIQDVDLIVCQIGADFCDYADRILAHHRNNGSFLLHGLMFSFLCFPF